MASTFDISDSDEFAGRPRAAESNLISTENEIGTAVCWGAIIAGALAATAVTMILRIPPSGQDRRRLIEKQQFRIERQCPRQGSKFLVPGGSVGQSKARF
jgi:hypothetical protein